MADIVPISGEVKTFFGNSGTEAVEASVKLAKYHTKRFDIIAFLGSFHGRSMGSLSLTSSKTTQRRGFGPLLPGVYHAPYATCYRCPVGLKPDTCQAECLDFVEQQMLVHLVSPDEVAAIVVEPIQGEGGYLVPPAQFHQRLRALTQEARHAAGGRRSAVGHGPHGEDVRDGALRRGAGHHRDGQGHCLRHAARRVLRARRRDELAARARTPARLAATRCRAPPPLPTIKLLRDSLVKNAAEVGAHLLAGARELMEKHPIIGDVRGKGLMIGIEFVKDRQTKERAVAERDAIVQACFYKGLLVLGAGKNAIRLSPALVISKAQADRALEILDEAIGEVAARG